MTKITNIVQGWLTTARWVPSPNFNARPENTCISLLVIHNISLPPGQFGSTYIESFFQNQLDTEAHPYFATIADSQVSSHFLITRDGEQVQFVSLSHRAWHAGKSAYDGIENCNDFSIGIELEGTDTIPYTDQQYLSLADLTRTLLMAFPDMAPDRIVGHSDIAPERKTDPGQAFDWRRYRTLL
ncbi:N-acetyl-anhydromuranmyl-L-alanine amidase [Candidatus Endobugula sertula]|uniref:1,6-anhydro-N-acetylmuramyl-L-alanine amidase AmpD n=1 Tax=Candidatus Endobugula sertula TaxID=62101 RepID=A0A1D2QQ36_9GAMM|nr:N-acetyl-anhydromuranmyl-L-alanine amidase [Candidatus Endobugula sertula]